MKKYYENGKLVAEGYLIPNPNFIKRGEYKETSLDQQKKQADILVTSIDGNYYTLHLNKPVEVKGRGMKRYSNGDITVTESVYNKLKEKYNVMCDF